MQSKKRRLFALFLTLTMLMTVVQPAFAAPAAGEQASVVPASEATDGQAQVNDTIYPTLGEALAAAPVDASVLLLKDVTLTGPLSLTNSVTLDLNGRTVLADGTALTVPAGRQLTIADSSADHSGRIVGRQLDGSAAADRRGVAVLVEAKGRLTVNAGTLVGQVINGSTRYADGRAVQSQGAVTVNGGKLIGVQLTGDLLKSTDTIGAYGVWNNTAATELLGDAQVLGLELSGNAANGMAAAVLSRSSVAVSGNAQLAGSLFLNGGSAQSNDFRSYAVSVQMGSGDVTVSDSAKLFALKNATDVRSSGCSAISYAAGGTVAIRGGSLDTLGGSTVNMDSGKQLIITDGASLTALNGPCVALYGDTVALAISGGLFRSEHPYRTANIEDYRADKTAGVSGGIFNHDFVRGQNAPALLAEGFSTQRGDLTDAGWTASETGAQYKVTDGSVTPVPQVTVTFMNGETAVDTRTLDAGAELGALPQAPAAPANKVFLGWQAEDGSFATDKTVADRNITYRAVFALEALTGRDVNFYAYVDGKLTLVSQADDLTVFWIDGRQCLDTKTLTDAYGKLGFRAEQLTAGGRLFPHAERNNGTIWAEAAKTMDGAAYAVTLNQKALTSFDLYYLPRQTVSGSAGREDPNVTAQNTFYTVTHDQDVRYFLNNTGAEIKLDNVSGQNWVMTGKDGTTVPAQVGETQTTFTLEQITQPYTLTLVRDQNTVLTAKVNGTEYSGADLAAILSKAGGNEAVTALEMVSGTVTQADLALLKDLLELSELTMDLDGDLEVLNAAGEPTTIIAPDEAQIVYADVAVSGSSHTPLKKLSMKGFTEIRQNGLKKDPARGTNGAPGFTHISLPDVVTVDNMALFNMSSLAVLDLRSAKTIGYSAFSGDKQLKELTLDAVETIGSNAFSGTDALTGFTFPATLKKLDNTAFAKTSNNNYKTLHVTMLGETAPQMTGTNFKGAKRGSTITVPYAGMSSYLKNFPVDGYAKLAQFDGVDVLVEGTYRIKFNGANSWEYATAFVKEGEALKASQIPTFAAPTEGQVIAGWTLKKNSSDILFSEAGYIPTSDLEVYALFRDPVTEFTVTFRADGMEDVVLTVEDGQTIGGSLPQAPAVEGKTFAGWFEGDTQITADTQVKGNITASARYTVNTYTVTVDGVKHENVKHGDKLSTVLPEPAAKEGQTFAGWFVNGVQVSGDTLVKGDMTVTAKYTVNTYTVTVDGVKHENVKYGDKLSTVLPEVEKKPGHTFAGWFVDDVQVSGDTQVKGDMTVTAKWDFNVFPDVKQEDWFYEGVRYATFHGLMAGLPNNLFGPGVQMNRAMVVQILYSMSGKPDAAPTDKFKDVPADEWYSKAVAWAVDVGVTAGYDNGCFGPDDLITREQLAVMLYSYSRASAVSGELNFTDAKDVSDWAKPAMQWAVSNSIMGGVGGNCLAPKATATRAEAAVMMMNLHQMNQK